MANGKRKKDSINIDVYSKLIRENKVFWDALEELKKEYDFPYDSLLEIGTGSANFLTKYLILNERSKDIGKFYAMEPVEEFFEESKRSVVRLSRTDATIHEYYGGNPFDIVTFAFVINHISPDKKAKFINNVYNNLADEESKLIILDMLIPNIENEDQRKEFAKNQIDEHHKLAIETDSTYIAKYIDGVREEKHEDYLYGKHKTTVKEMEKMLNAAGFDEVTIKPFKGKVKGIDWEKIGIHIIVAEKE